MKNESLKPSVLLVAIAKDEAAYLPEWIFHHLNAGVAEVLVLVNATSDNSIATLEKIALKYPVRYEIVDDFNFGEVDDLIADDFLNRNAFQSKAYAYAYTKCDSNKFSHLLFLDIDEFLICQNNNIPKVIEDYAEANVIHFSWLNCTGDQTDFTPLTQCTHGDKSNYTKFLVKSGLDNLTFVSTHLAQDNDTSQPLAGEGTITIDGQIYQGEKWSKSHFILHRFLRSEMEYLSLLGRSDLYNKTIIGLKNNRKGWRTSYKYKVSLPCELCHSYEQRYQTFVDDCQLQEELGKAKIFVENRATSVKEQILQVKSLNSQLDQVLAGCDLTHHNYTWFNLLKQKVKNKLGLNRPKHLV